LVGEVSGVCIYDDFAHHPTAIAATLDAMAARLSDDNEVATGRLIAVIEPRSNTMKMGVHQLSLLKACARADISLWLQPASAELLDLHGLVQQSDVAALVFDDTQAMVQYLVSHCQPGDHVVIMSNGGFEGIHQRLLQALDTGSL
jgi:UDP-N-acetylmuramate: L-alanyl-gamma-D-glutamyl-meso-diaminopimelate ligase